MGDGRVLQTERTARGLTGNRWFRTCSPDNSRNIGYRGVPGGVRS